MKSRLISIRKIFVRIRLCLTLLRISIRLKVSSVLFSLYSATQVTFTQAEHAYRLTTIGALTTNKSIFSYEHGSIYSVLCWVSSRMTIALVIEEIFTLIRAYYSNEIFRTFFLDLRKYRICLHTFTYVRSKTNKKTTGHLIKKVVILVRASP